MYYIERRIVLLTIKEVLMKHYRKFLESMEDMTNAQMVKACEAAGLQRIGNGSARVVFALNDRLVIKIALGHAGVSQNENEIRLHHMLDYDFPGWKKYFAKVFVNLCHYKDYFIVMERLNTKFQGRLRYEKDLYKTRFRTVAVRNRRAVLHYKAVAFIDDILGFINSNDMHCRNLGMSANGCIKMLDFGLSTRTFNHHYGFVDTRRVKRERLY